MYEPRGSVVKPDVTWFCVFNELQQNNGISPDIIVSIPSWSYVYLDPRD